MTARYANPRELHQTGVFPQVARPERGAAMLLRHRLDTRFDLRCLNRSPVGWMILAPKGRVDSGWEASAS
jgi:hypothetical protein